MAQQFWLTIPLPSPHPNIPPGYAITGKPAYLVTNGIVTPPPFTTATVLGPLTVTAHGSYELDWGDGSSSGPFNVEGQPWPDGIITHTYDNVGTYTVTLTETWSATWTLGAASGALGGLHTAGSIPRFQVHQLQAVIGG